MNSLLKSKTHGDTKFEHAFFMLATNKMKPIPRHAA